MEMWRRICEKIGKDRFLILLIGGLLLLVIAYPVDGRKKAGTKNPAGQSPKTVSGGSEGAAGERAGTGGSEYQQALEKSVAAALSKMAGVGKAEVLITFADEGSRVTEKDAEYRRENTEKEGEGGRLLGETTVENTEKTVYTVNENGDEIPFVKNTLVPKVQGVLVVAGGGGERSVAAEIKEAIMVLFGIDEHRIKIAKMKGDAR